MKNLLLFSFFFTSIAFGQTVMLTPSQDNSMFQDSPNNSNGQGPLFSGNTCGSSSRRALMQFDLSAIPSGSVVTSVTLDLNCNQVSGSGAGTSTYTLQSVTQNWGEGTSFSNFGIGAAAVSPDATWNESMFASTPWTTSGGDYLPAILTTVSIPYAVGTYTFPSTANFISAVQGWIDAPATNNGVILIGDEGASCTARRFGSKESGIAPVLTVTYVCGGPTAVCQDVTVYLDGAGNASIVAADVDGGSTDDCGTGTLNLTVDQTTFDCSDLEGPEMIITGAYDGPLPGGLPKGVELKVNTDIPDLSDFGLGSANNGGGTDGQEFTFPAVSATAGQFIYVTSDSAGFHDFFGFAADYISGSMLINGDDAVELFQGGAVVDVFGDINTDGTGQAWEFLDGWAYRNNMESPNGGTFNDANWFYSGINALDGETTNSGAATPFPIGSFVSGTSGVSVKLYATDGNTDVDSCLATVTVLDTMVPVPDIATLADINASCEVTALTPPTATDNCAVVSVTNNATLPITTLGTTVVTWTYMDASGNTTTQDQNVIVGPYNTVDTYALCDSLVWIDGNTYYASNNVATHTLSSMLGCDSIVTLDLTIYNTTPTFVQFIPIKDNSIYSENSNSNGLGRLYSGTTNSGNQRRALVQFDVSSLPAGAVVTNVSLDVNVDQYSGSTANDHDLHFLTTDWGEGTSSGGGAGAAPVAPDATWNEAMFSTVSWTTPGGDYTATSSATTTFTASTGPQVFASTGMVDDVNAWISAPANNFGWMIIGDETMNQTARRMGSKDAGTAPVLNIGYIIPNQYDTTTVTQCVSYTTPGGQLITTSGIYADTVTTLDGCDSISYHDVTINTVDVSTALADPMITANATGATYQWLDCDNSFSALAGETNQSYTATANGNFAVEVTENGCTDTSACETIVSLSIGQLGDLGELKIFPNPSSEIVNIQLESTVESIEVRLTDLSGKLILVEQFKLTKLMSITLPEESGVYYLQLRSGEETSTVKVIRL